MLAPDDIEVGLLVTILRQRQKVNPMFGGGEAGWVNGDGYHVCEILAVSLPFVAIKCLSVSGHPVGTINLQDHQLITVTPEYAEALMKSGAVISSTSIMDCFSQLDESGE